MRPRRVRVVRRTFVASMRAGTGQDTSETAYSGSTYPELQRDSFSLSSQDWPVATAPVHPTLCHPAETLPCSDTIAPFPTIPANLGLGAGSAGSADSCTTNPWAMRATDSRRARPGNGSPTTGAVPSAACRNPNSIRFWIDWIAATSRRPKPSRVPRAAQRNRRYRHSGRESRRSRADEARQERRRRRSIPPRWKNPSPEGARAT